MAFLMTLRHRRSALRASGWHLLVSAGIASLAAVLVFGLWYPAPYSDLSGGRDLFLIVMTVDVLCGPLLTLVLFNPRKPRRELFTDLCLVVLIQLAALAYGVNTMALARPVFLAFEKDRFRVVSSVDMFLEKLAQAPLELQSFGYTGPKVIAVHVARPEDADYMEELDRALTGREASTRPERWVLYETQRAQVLAKAQPLPVLAQKYPLRQVELARLSAATGLPDAELLWLPIRGRETMAWVALLNKKTTEVVGFAPFDGF